MKKENEIRAVSHMALVITVMVFSLVLTILNLSLGWERWTIPLFIVAAIVCPIFHITGRLSDEGRIYLYSAVFMVELFYYSVNVDTVYDSSPVFCLALVIFAMTQETVLTWICMIIAGVSTVWIIMARGHAGTLIFQTSNIVRTIWHIILILIAGIVTSQLLKAIKRADKAKNDRIEELEKETESASDFLANVSHEIRTPVNAVMGLTRVCMDMDTDEKMQRHLRAISDAGKRVGEQISDILDFSEIDMNKLAVNKEDYMPSSLLADLVAQVAPYKDNDVELIIDVSPELPSVMNTDVSKLKKILWHLVMNGLKYTKEGGVYVHISPIKQEYGINMLIEVRDTGIGIGSDDLDRICNRFYQSNSGRNRSTNGLGLGLSIVSGFVRSLKGFMTIESEKGIGTTVRVSLPQEVVDESECMTLAHRESVSLGAYLDFDKYKNPYVREYYNNMLKDMVKGLKVSMHRVDKVSTLKALVKSVTLTHLFVAAEEYETCSDYIDSLADSMVVVVVADRGFKPNPGSKVRVMEKPFYCFPVISVLDSSVEDYERENTGRMYCRGVRALVVDDEPMNLIVATSFLGRYDMVVTTVSSGMDGIQKCREEDFDIVFMDHMMPEMDGVEAMKRIRSEAERAKKVLPIVALTANAVSSAKEMFMREGFDGFISKPIEEGEFERVLKKVLPKDAVTYEFVEDTGDSGSKEMNSKEPAKQSDDNSVGKNADDPGKKLEACGVDMATGLGFTKNDKEFYQVLLKQYVTDREDKRNKLDRYFSDGDDKNYEIIVHALKSTSKTIGAMDMFDAAKALEDAAAVNDHDFMKAHHDELMSKYDSLCDCLAEIFGMDTGDHLSDDKDDITGDDDILEFAPGED